MIDKQRRALRCASLAPALMILFGCAGHHPAVEPSPSQSLAPDQDPSVKLERKHESYAFDARLAHVKIVNHYGDVRLRKFEQNEVGLEAVIQRIGMPAREPHFAISKSADTWELRIGFADDSPEAVVDTRRGRVDLVVFVPDRASLDVETQAGTLQAGRFIGDVRARTDSGRLIASTRGRMNLQSSDGEIIARQLGTDFAGDTTIRSESGTIFLGIPTQGDYRLEVVAGGGISITDAWKPGEINAPVDAARKFTLVRGTGESGQIKVQTGATVTLAPVILLDPAD